MFTYNNLGYSIARDSYPNTLCEIRVPQPSLKALVFGTGRSECFFLDFVCGPSFNSRETTGFLENETHPVPGDGGIPFARMINAQSQ
ncbi:hypothetical protein GF325_07045 [Candidatus Bathyarchaeota archaeon]|nr:hypothetical protein [Candidatus Bathyarchaeota archaeon]